MSTGDWDAEHLRPDLGSAADVGRRAAGSAPVERRRGSARRRLRLGQDHGRARSPRAPGNRLRRRRGAVDGRPHAKGAGQPRDRPLPGSDRAGLARTGRRRVLQRHLPLDPRSRRVVRRAVSQSKAGWSARSPSAAGGATSTPSGGSPSRWPPRSRSRRTSRVGASPGTTRPRRRPRARLHGAGFTERLVLARGPPDRAAEPRNFVKTVCLVRHLDRFPPSCAGPSSTG